MKKPRFTDSQIIAVLKQAEIGTSVPELCREHGISTATFHLAIQVRRHGYLDDGTKVSLGRVPPGRRQFIAHRLAGTTRS